MVVHVGELHTDIRPADPPGEDPEQQPGGGRTVEDLWRESRGRTTWLEARTSASGYDD